MILAGARIATTATNSFYANLAIRYGRIALCIEPRHSVRTLDLNGCLILPGLINAHDHLEFNLFPRLGAGPYPNAAEWAEDIHRVHYGLVRQHLEIPKTVRLIAGGVKNLIGGVTTVAHHNPYEPDVFNRDFPVRVLKRYGWAHSLTFYPNPWECYRRTPAGAPFFVHAGEGTDELARQELRRLDHISVLGSTTVIVHGVAFGKEELHLIKQRKASLVWCPSSNHFTLGRSLTSEVFTSGLPVALGTDSSLTAEGHVADEISCAHQTVGLSDLYSMVTEGAARILRLSMGEGRIQEGGVADLVVVRDEGQTPGKALLGITPELVFLKGRIRLISTAMASRLGDGEWKEFQRIEVEGRGCWLIDCDVASVWSAVTAVLGDEARLANRRVRI
jgi:cytosine/adenosine deaminase-related metal-dependent hydrolase